MTLPVSINDLLVTSDRTPVDRLFFNKRFTAVYNALANLDTRVSSFGETEDTLVQLGLDRLNVTLGPLLTTLQEAADLGFLQCKAVGNTESLVSGEAEGFIVTEGAELFTPTPYLLVQDTEDSDNWGVCSVDSGGWTKETGDLALHTIFANKPATSSTSWVISASSGVLPSMQSILQQAVEIRDTVTALQASIAGDVATLEALVEIVQSEPVASVAGKTGVVTLEQSDINGLIDALAAKASISWTTTQLAGKQGADGKLTAISTLAWLADRILYTTSASTISTLPVTTLTKSLLAAGSVSTALSVLGVSSLMKDLLADTTEEEAQATLGIVTSVPAANFEIWGGTGANKALTSAAITTASVVTSLTDATTVVVDWNTGINFSVTLTADRVLGNPNGGIPGTMRTVLVQGSSSTPRTLTFGTYYLGNIPTISDITSSRWYLLSIFCISSTHFVVSSVRAK